jgi:hypothetical protein
VVRRNLKLSALLVVAAGICVFPLQASANTKTVSVDSSGRLTTPTTSGKITFTKLAPNTTYSGVDGIEALPVGTGFAHGRYTLSWGACTHGSAVGGSFKIVSGGSYPTTLPKTSPATPPIKIKTNDDGVFQCAYTLAYPAGNVPEKAVKVKNDFWVVKDGTIVAKDDSKSVLPGAGPPVPEVPMAILIPIGMLLVIAGYLLFIRRRQTVAIAPA